MEIEILKQKICLTEINNHYQEGLTLKILNFNEMRLLKEISSYYKKV